MTVSTLSTPGTCISEGNSQGGGFAAWVTAITFRYLSHAPQPQQSPRQFQRPPHVPGLGFCSPLVTCQTRGSQAGQHPQARCPTGYLTTQPVLSLHKSHICPFRRVTAGGVQFRFQECGLSSCGRGPGAACEAQAQPAPRLTWGRGVSTHRLTPIACKCLGRAWKD